MQFDFSKAVYSPVMYYKEDKYLLYLFPVYGIIDGYRYDYNPIVGAVVYRMDNLLEDMIGMQSTDSAAVLVDQDNLLYSNRTLTQQETIALKNTEADDLEMTTSECQYLVETIQLSIPGWKLMMITPEDSLFSGIPEARYLLLWIMLAAMVLAGWLS